MLRRDPRASPVFHALSLGALVHRRRDIDVPRLVASVIDAGIVPGSRQMQVRVIGPLLPQRQKVGLAAPGIAEGVENAPTLVPEHFPGPRVSHGLPLGAEAMLRQRPDRQHDVRVDIAVGALMDGPVRREPAAGELFGYEQPREPDIFLKRKFGWQSDLDLAGELRVQPLFVGFDAVPEFLRSRHRVPGRGAPKGLSPRKARPPEW